MSSNFKPGDIVKRIDGAWKGMEVGDIATVEFMDDGGVKLKEFSPNKAVRHSRHKLKTIARGVLFEF